MNCDISFPCGLRKFILRGLVAVGLFGGTPAAWGFYFTPTELEFKSWPIHCQGIYLGTEIAKKSGFSGRMPAKEVGKWRRYAYQHGGAWHYCEAPIQINRALLAQNPVVRKKHYDSAVSAALWSYIRTSNDKPWKAEMGTTLARAYRGTGDIKNAEKYSKEVIHYFPGYVDAYSVLSLIYKDSNDNVAAKEILVRGNKVAKEKSAEILYFLGLISLDLGEVEEAKIYAEKATLLGYPLSGLNERIKRLKKSED